MENHSDAVIITLTLAAFGAIVYGVAANLIQLVGAGAILGMSFNLVRYFFDRASDRRKRRDEGIKRLLPDVYKPMFSWSVRTSQYMKKFDGTLPAFSFPSAPELSEDPEYNSLVGDKLRTRFNRLVGEANELGEIRKEVVAEYHSRLRGMLHEAKPDWKYTDVTLSSDGGTMGLNTILYSFDLQVVNDLVSRSTKFTLTIGHEAIVCSDDFLKAIRQPETLESWSRYQSAWSKLKEDVNSFCLLMQDTVRNGEPDWRL